SAEDHRPAFASAFEELLIEVVRMRFGHRQSHRVADRFNVERDDRLGQMTKFFEPLDMPRDGEFSRRIADENFSLCVDAAVFHPEHERRAFFAFELDAAAEEELL